MNNVSWFIYFADILSGIQIFLGMFGLFSLVAALLLIIFSISYENQEKYHEESKKWTKEIVYPCKFLRPWGVVVLILSFVMMLSAIAIPSKETRYMIAASQIGEQIIQLEEVQDIGGEVGGLTKDVIQLLREQISSQLIEKPAEGEN